MKKTILPFYQSNLLKLLIYSALISIFFIQQVPAKASVYGSDPVSSVAASPEKLRAFSYIMQNSLVMKVHFENPAQEKISIQILNSHKQVVYKENMGKREIFIGKFNLQELPNGNYTLEVQSPSHTYSRSFSLQTFTKLEISHPENISY